MEINGQTRLAAVIANPIKHSLSPLIHNFSFEQLNENGVYLAFEIVEQDLQTTIASIKSLEMYGANLSMPYKEAALPYSLHPRRERQHQLALRRPGQQRDQRLHRWCRSEELRAFRWHHRPERQPGQPVPAAGDWRIQGHHLQLQGGIRPDFGCRCGGAIQVRHQYLPRRRLR